MKLKEAIKQRKEMDKLHARLRREKKCNIPVETLNRISLAAKNRDTRLIFFSETLMPNVQLQEWLDYDTVTGHVWWSASFRAHNGKHLLYIGDKP